MEKTYGRKGEWVRAAREIEIEGWDRFCSALPRERERELLWVMVCNDCSLKLPLFGPSIPLLSETLAAPSSRGKLRTSLSSGASYRSSVLWWRFGPGNCGGDLVRPSSTKMNSIDRKFFGSKKTNGGRGRRLIQQARQRHLSSLLLSRGLPRHVRCLRTVFIFFFNFVSLTELVLQAFSVVL